jgi:hypothetical protein
MNPNEPLGAQGIKALKAERATNRRLRQELHNLRAAVIAMSNALVDVVEKDGGQRHGR